MFEIPLHIGTEHPNVLWLLITGLLAFGGGLAVGLRAGDRHDGEHEAVPDIE